MSAITPNSEIRLLKCPIESDNLNQITFASATTQYNYFNGLNHLVLDGATYQRHDGIIRYPEHIDNILEYNYVMYQNENYSNKWFYAFITRMEYVNDHMTNIYIKQDVFQTWQFDLVYKKCFVEREHVNDDTIGKHTIPEGLETGDYIVQAGTESASAVADLFYLENKYIIVGVSEIPGVAYPSSYQYGRVYNGVYSGLLYIAFKDGHQLDLFIQGIQGATTEDVIYSVFMVPKDICTIAVSDWVTVSVGGVSCELAYYPYTTGSTSLGTFTIKKESTLAESYSPKNNKLFCYPYRYFVLSNNAGNNAIYKYELFTTTGCTFSLKGVVTPGCSIKAIPQNYREGSLIKSLDAGKLPTCTWTNDSYTNWLTQNAVNLPLDTALNVAKIVGGTAVAVGTGGMGGLAGGGVALSGFTGIAETMKSVYEHSLVPETAKGGANQGDLMFAEKETFSYYKMSIRSEYASLIDNYFSMYGYKVNEVKLPNITGRSNWNYVKTINAIIEGNVPQEYLEEIKSLFNRGITLWHTTQYYLDYSRTNNIV